MGIGCSRFLSCFSNNAKHHVSAADDDDLGVEEAEQAIKLPAFREFGLEELRIATDDFSGSNIVSEQGDDAPNVVYRGLLEDGKGSVVAVKRFDLSSWPDARKFLDEARAVGQLRSDRLVNLLGCCCERDERILVTEFMHNEALPNHLFHWDEKPLLWSLRLRVALYVAQALIYCCKRGRPMYHDLDSYKVLFDQQLNPRLSCFGLMNNNCQDGDDYSSDLSFVPPEFLKTGIMIPESVVYCFGTVLLDLLTAKHVPPSQALEMIQKDNVARLMDSSLEGHLSGDDMAKVIKLAMHCLQSEPRERPSLVSIATTLYSLQRETNNVPSYVLIGMSSAPLEFEELSKLSPLAQACSVLNLETIHDILVDDDEAAAIEAAGKSELQMRGDSAFRAKDFSTAIDCYTELYQEDHQGISPRVLARRCVCYLTMGMPQEALADGMRAQIVSPRWHVPFYLQSAALLCLRMDSDAQNTLTQGCALEHLGRVMI